MKTINSLRSKLLALTLALMASVSTFAYNFGDDGLFFNIIDNDNKLVEVTYQHERSEQNYSKLTHVTIPDTVLRGRVKYAVVSIGSMAFYKCKTLESIVIPDHIKSIGTNAFSECSALTSVSLPNTITYLNSSLFSNCTALRTFTIPDNITSIYGSVFESCSSLSEINIPSSVTSIGKYAFRYCNSLKSITIPNSVKSIYRGAFYKCKALTDITLPDSLTTVSQEMFYECTALESITIPIGVTHIENNAFYWCSNLKTMTLHANIEYIDGAFNQTSISTYILAMRSAEEACTNRVNKILHDIGQQYSTRKITINGEKVRDLVVPNTIDSISDYAFAYSYIASVNIPNNLKRINPTAFYKCPSLQSVHWNALDFEEVSSAANAPFNKVASQIHTFKFGRDIKHIPAYLCYDMNRLDSIEIPAGVKSIGKHAFAHCSPSVVICHASQVPNIDESAFSKDYVSNTILYVPAESVETYKDSEQWNKFAHIVAIGEEINDTDSDWDWWLVHDFAVDNFGYAIIENATTPSVQIIEAVGKSGHVDIPTEVVHNDTLYKVTGLGTGIVTTFRYSPDLTSVFIPKEILLVNNAVFADCPNLESIVVEEGNVHQDSRDNCNAVIRNLYADRSPELVIGCKNTTIPDGVLSIGSYAFRGCKGLQEIEVPSSVTTIYQDAFYDCISLKSVVLGENITSINDLAFYNCYNLEKVVCLALTPPSKGASAFNNTPITDPDIEERAPIYVPDASVEIYKQAWKNYNIQPLSSISSYKSQWCDTWNVMWFDGMRFDETASTSKYRLGKDTIIGDYTYSKFTSRTSVRFTSDRKVYVYYEGFDDNDPYTPDLPTGEYLAYDFSAKVGDTLEVFSGIGTYSTYPCVVDDVETAPSPCVVDDVQADLKTFPLIIKLHPLCDVDGEGNMEISSEEITWIEGVGSPEGFLISYLPCGWGGGGTFALLCAHKGDELKYTGSLYDEYGCEYNATEQTPEDLFPTLWGLQRTSFTEYSECSDSYASLFQSKGETITINNNQYLKFGGHYLREENKQVLLYSRLQDKDLVLYDYSLEVGDTLTTLNIDYRREGIPFDLCYVDYAYEEVGMSHSIDTLIVTDISYVTLLDGTEHKQWTFDNGMQYVEGIGNFGQSRWSGDFFGLVKEPATPTCLMGEHLVCVSKNNKLLYQMDEAEMERLGAECLCEAENPEDLFPTLWGLQRTEVEYHTDGAGAPSLVSFNEYTPTLVNGKWYLYDGRNYLREENNQVLLYAPDAEIYEDIVLYDWTLEVGDTLPYHNKSVYRESDYIVTDVSTITLLDGKEYKKWTLACGYEYIEGIGVINGHGYGLFLCLPHYSHLATYIHTSLVCASKNGKLLYQMDDAEMERLGAECLCDYNSGPKKDHAKDGQIGGRPTPTQWNQLEVVLCKLENNNNILQAETFSYTLEDISQQVNNKTYFQLARQSTKDTATTKSVVGALHFGKDEDNRVYFLRDGVEYVLYDFTAEPGDTVEIFAGINNYPQETTYTHVVVDKDTTEDGACRMLLEVVFPDDTNATAENAEKVWLAGLGSVDGIVHNAAKRTSNAHAAPSRSASSSETESSVMLCAWREDSCLYTTDHPDYDTFGCVYNQEPTSVKDIHSSQSSYQKLLRDGQLFIIHDGKTYNVLGVKVN